MFRIQVTREFDAAHFLLDTNTKCDQLHGHRWSVTCTFACTKLTKQGWVVNFTTAKKWIDGILSSYDHNILNFYLEQPTAENLCLSIYVQLSKCVAVHRGNNPETDVYLEKVQISETPGNNAEFSCYDIDLRSLMSRRFWSSEKSGLVRTRLAEEARKQWSDPDGRQKKQQGMQRAFSEEECSARSERMQEERNPMRNRKVVEKMITSLRKAQKLSPNKEEQAVIEFLKVNHLPLEFVGDGKLVIDGKIPDFVNLEKHLVVEYNNRFWYTDSNPYYNVKDDSEDRKKFFNQRGWRIYFIWDDEFQSNPQKIFSDLQEALK